jgi:hypothetical protein
MFPDLYTLLPDLAHTSEIEMGLDVDRIALRLNQNFMKFS